ncbi:MAG TPA: metalloregulator ArsR/SmtB family transcription factor [Chloroflexia bacterium]|nr:metalloregulator ArsR/SmtB family transcription factor [Chloroflexia bacterium]
MDQGLASLRGVTPEREPLELREAGEHVPPVLSAERASAAYALKPFLKAVADVNRLAILQELSREEGLSVLDLSDRLLLSQPLTSWHLHILKRARLVSPTHLGRQRIYRLNRDRLQEYRELFNWVIDL